MIRGLARVLRQLVLPALILIAGLGFTLAVLLRPEWLATLAMLIALGFAALIGSAVLVHVYNHGIDPPASDGPAPVVALIDRITQDPQDARARRQLRRRLSALARHPVLLRDRTEQELDILRRVLLQMDADGVCIGWLARPRRHRRDQLVGAIQLLAWLRSRRSGEVLAAQTLGSDPELVYSAASGLASLDHPRAYEALLDLLERGTVPAARVACLLEDAAFREPLEPLLRRAASPEWRVRFWVAYLAGRTSDPRAFPMLARLMADESPDVRANAAEAVGTLKVEAARPLLHDLLADETWFVRAHAAKGLELLGPAPSVDRLTPLLCDQFWWVREDATRALAAAGPAANGALRTVLSGPDRFARNKAAEVLVRTGFLRECADRIVHGNGERAPAARDLLAMVDAGAEDPVWSALEGIPLAALPSPLPRSPNRRTKVLAILHALAEPDAPPSVGPDEPPPPLAGPDELPPMLPR